MILELFLKMSEYANATQNACTCPRLSEKQKSFVSITQAFIWLTFVIVVATGSVLIWYTTDNINSIENSLNKFNNISVIANYLKNPKKFLLEDECISFDGNSITIKSPMILSANAKPNLQFENGLHVNGMMINPGNPISFTKSILFESNADMLRSFIVGSYPPNAYLTAIGGSSNNLFFGNPGQTEISLVSSQTCVQSGTAGSTNYPFPGVYIRSTVGGYQLCLCMANWVYRTNAQTFNTYLFAFPGTGFGIGPYNTPGEYCVSLT